MFTLAHLSDPHLAPLKAPRLKDLATKRFYGHQSWIRRRRFIHRREVLDAMMEDIRRAQVDHVAVTGDLVNISTRSEFRAAAQWLASLGTPDHVTIVPGNHDAYVPVRWEKGLGLWQDYFTGDLSLGKQQIDNAPFPFIRTRRNVALIGLSTAVPTPMLVASGMLGARQIHRLAEILPMLKERGFFRVVLIHHPPLPGMNSPRKALEDAAALRDVLEREGAELVLHGHNHEHSLRQVFSRTGPVQVVGVPSASALGRHGKPPAAWYCYRISRAKGQWQCGVTVRSFDEASGRFHETESFRLDMNPAAEQPRDPVLLPVS
ncbi:metallophosphoesterase family protein [Rhodoligotrophos defluvii]|uniref:metallophosphoesterase family protein n=1 Tax=Rhodoligotrophos defluvii TaxID=2561934 RepID=UPI0010C9B5A8|nr:metallophosphoesterase [Rhodoligotrophos defluvii]